MREPGTNAFPSALSSVLSFRATFDKRRCVPRTGFSPLLTVHPLFSRMVIFSFSPLTLPMPYPPTVTFDFPNPDFSAEGILKEKPSLTVLVPHLIAIFIESLMIPLIFSASVFSHRRLTSLILCGDSPPNKRECALAVPIHHRRFPSHLLDSKTSLSSPATFSRASECRFSSGSFVLHRFRSRALRRDPSEDRPLPSSCPHPSPSCSNRL